MSDDPRTGDAGDDAPGSDDAPGGDDGPAAASLDRDDLTPEQQVALEELLFRLADDEFVHAERLTEWQIFAPTIESDLALANVAQDEFGHARLWYDLLQELGYTEEECIWRRPAGEWTHATLVERPFDDDGWGDAVVRTYLYDVAERIRLEALVDTSYAPLADRVGKALAEEEYHREHALSWLERLASDDDARERLQAAVDDLFAHALSLWCPGEHEAEIRAAGFRRESLTSMREEWLDTVVPTLEGYGLVVPEPDGVARPEARGRDGSHTDDWFDLYEAFTATHREVDFDRPARLRGEEA
ncbi:phenylacetate-CoA oxygenase subunit PaaC [Halobaculum sp. CBA1158]|uniref:1,2-phenylacetyl-CoA epoxidase subunit PaaC n=1 Tax=Halobaculum sp. CBA1158 TaxID=2904243 RepID=UPI001F31BA14|nr:1,2-phenylacetyl-CoA epoxidase subunit PaaC [Halobaculum sp. CBA1158]UIP00587.1 phenylacetate-CoA oxygenase subunit PaaC [Halobaculum sp. CBA1158]